MTTAFHQKFFNYAQAEKLVLLGAPSDFETVFKRYTDMMGYNSRIVNGLDQLVIEEFNHDTSYFSVSEFAKDDAEQIIANYKNATLKTTTGFGHGLKNKVVDNYIIEFINS